MRLLGGMALGIAVLGTALGSVALATGLEQTFLGFALGIGVALFSVVSISLISAAVLSRFKERRSGVAFAILAFLVKLPILALAIWYASRLGSHAVIWFVLGMAVVYFALAGAALWLERRPAQRSD